jgi:hypothetical protein
MVKNSLHHRGRFMNKKLPKLTLNQETLQNLTYSEKTKAVNATVPVFACRSIPSPTCPECAPPAA